MTAPKPADAWQQTLPVSIPLHVRRNIAEGTGGCWLWTRSCSSDGYGWASLKNRTYQAHRLVFTLTQGEVPEGLVLDHKCRVRHCVNPAHLEPVTPRENLRRGLPGSDNCLRCGTPFNQAPGSRRCIPCNATYEAARREQKRQAEAARRARLRGAA